MFCGSTELKKCKAVSQTPCQNSQPPLPQKSKPTYSCLCTYYCKGLLKQITWATYLKNAQYCERDTQREAGMEADQTTAIALPLKNGNEPESFEPKDIGVTKVLTLVMSIPISSSLTVRIQRIFLSPLGTIFLAAFHPALSAY